LFYPRSDGNVTNSSQDVKEKTLLSEKISDKNQYISFLQHSSSTSASLKKFRELTICKNSLALEKRLNNFSFSHLKNGECLFLNNVRFEP